MLAWPPCKTMELPCFFSMAVAIVLWLLSWHDSNHLSDRHHLVFLLIQSLLVSLDFFHDMMEWGNPVTWDLLVQISKFFLKTSHWVFPGAKANSPLVFCWKTLLMNWLLNNLGGENSWSPLLHRAAEDLLAPGHFWSFWHISLPWGSFDAHHQQLLHPPL